MCRDCGCSAGNGHHDHHEHGPNQHDHDHHHPDQHHHRRVISVHEAVLSKNDRLARANRDRFRSRRVKVINLLSSPGSGKTSLLERTLADLGDELRIGVIVGDLATENDASRLRATGAPVVQITTGTVCHLEADMVARALERFNLDDLDLLVIENVGNLVCPASFDLGEDLRVVLFSVTEGEDKPVKYPVMFQTAQVVLLSKLDLADAVGFDRETALRNIRTTAPNAEIREISARTGEGLSSWYALLRESLVQSPRA